MIVSSLKRSRRVSYETLNISRRKQRRRVQDNTEKSQVSLGQRATNVDFYLWRRSSLRWEACCRACQISPPSMAMGCHGTTSDSFRRGDNESSCWYHRHQRSNTDLPVDEQVVHLWQTRRSGKKRISNAPRDYLWPHHLVQSWSLDASQRVILTPFYDHQTDCEVGVDTDDGHEADS